MLSKPTTGSVGTTQIASTSTQITQVITKVSAIKVSAFIFNPRKLVGACLRAWLEALGLLYAFY